MFHSRVRAQVKRCIPANLRRTSKDIPLYIRMWQWQHWHTSQHAALLTDFDRQSFVKETLHVKHSKGKHKFHKKTEVMFNTKMLDSLEKTIYLQTTTANTSNNHDVTSKNPHETTTPCILSKQHIQKITIFHPGLFPGRFEMFIPS